jgi:FlaA1/EpsC-like NDP-sugar epimerase
MPFKIGLASLVGILKRGPRWRRAMVWVTELALIALCGAAAFLLRFDFNLDPLDLRHLAWGLAIWIPVKLVVFWLTGLDRGWGRFVSIHNLAQIAFGNIAGSAFSTILIHYFAPKGFPRSIYLIDLLLCFVATSGVRVLIRIAAEVSSQGRPPESAALTLVYGAGTAGDILIRELRANPRLPYRVAGFVDDNPSKKGLRIQGVAVLGTGRDLGTLVSKHNAEQVLIAIPSATGPQMKAILERCRSAGVHCKTVPGLDEVLRGGPLTGKIREVEVEDLLGRIPINLETDRIAARLQGRTVLVTGAAGSIGSELCRQIARFGARAIVGFDMAESALFYLEREMRASFPGAPFHPEIGNVQNGARVSEVLEAYAPSMVFHAAAYKHVPMMEAHLFEAVENNVFGTQTAAMACARRGVEDFVMISSDKAVRPTSIMGATKRLAELVVSSIQDGGTKLVSVRFGNVLGSNGSVIPLFKGQIAAGGPVTVTHPEMRRFFMTIPEAVQLVLQALAIGKGGEIFVLDMGEPVKILDLASHLILLSGLRPGEDIKIEFTGLRPGEKLYEELATREEWTVPTSHEKIKVFVGPSVLRERMRSSLAALEEICGARDTRRLVELLKELIPDYNPSSLVLEKASNGRRSPSSASAASSLS